VFPDFPRKHNLYHYDTAKPTLDGFPIPFQFVAIFIGTIFVGIVYVIHLLQLFLLLYHSFDYDLMKFNVSRKVAKNASGYDRK